jgi:predicted glycogen debranching enzyme
MPMGINFGREICGRLDLAEAREWIVTNGTGSYAAGTVAGLLTRCYHGLLIAAVEPPLGRMLMLAKLDDTVLYGDPTKRNTMLLHYPLHTNRWSDGSVGPHGYRQIERFSLDGTIPVWRYACADALLEKRIWMQPGANTTYVYYQLLRATQPFSLTLKAMVNYRDHHSRTQGSGWQMTVVPLERGVCVSAFPEAAQLMITSDRAEATTTHDWYYGYDLAAERERGLSDRDDHLHAATLQASLAVGESLTIAISTDARADLNGESALKNRRIYDGKLLGLWKSSRPSEKESAFANRLVLAADQFIVNRSSPAEPNGKTILAGYPWFSDWGRDTMISLPGLTLTTGRPEIARSILRVYAHYADQGMIPNRFPDAGETPEYNTVDATLWYFEALRAYYSETEDDDLILELFPILAEIIDWHCRGTRFNIHLDPADGLLYAGETGTQLTWMDAKVGDWVVTPRIGKPVEVNALWYNALRTIAKLARRIGKPHQEYEAIADRALARFSRFWHPGLGYCYDVLDGPDGDDESLRPNQIFAVSLPESPLNAAQQRGVVDICAQTLLTSHGLRSLAPDQRQYQGKYQGTPLQRDAAYHQGTVWGWLLGPFAIAHLRVYHNPGKAKEFLEPMMNHLYAYGVGSLSEIFDGDAPMNPHGCFAQAWTVAEILRAWQATELG